MKPTNLVSIDFDEIRESIKSYLRTRNEFTDYDFTGSTLSYLIDVLAYNTYYSSFNANMALNEMFLDTASIRDNVVSLARYINYLPQSVSAAKACITLVAQTQIGVDGTYPTTVTLLKGDIASGSVGGVAHSFVIIDEQTVSVNRATGIAIFNNFKVYEGSLLSYEYVVNTNIQQNFIIPNDNVDIETLKVFIKPNSQSTQYDRYNQVKNITNVESTDKVFFLNETADRRYELTFGDGIIGRKLIDNEIVYFEYVRTNGEIANNINRMGYIGQIIDVNGNEIVDATLTLNDKSQLGAPAETLKQIKFNAPKYYSAQNRAVTSSDYEAIVKNIYPNAKYVNAFGGELLDPPVYGKVIISIKTNTGNTINNLTKSDLVAKLRPYSIASIETVIVDPEEFYVDLTLFVAADTFKSKLSSGELNQNTSDDIKKKIIAAMQDYGDMQDLGNFGSKLPLSQLEKVILNADPNISDVQFATTPYKSVPYEDLTSPKTYPFNFGISLDCDCDSAAGETVKSSVFYTTGISEPQFIEDNGLGGLRSFYIKNNNKVITNNSIGSYDCNTGKVLVGPIKTICPPPDVAVDCPILLIISIKPTNPNAIVAPPGTLLVIPTPTIVIGSTIPTVGPGSTAGNPTTFSPNSSVFSFTSPVTSTGTGTTGTGTTGITGTGGTGGTGTGGTGGIDAYGNVVGSDGSSASCFT